jgi:hypothetical protein
MGLDRKGAGYRSSVQYVDRFAASMHFSFPACNALKAAILDTQRLPGSLPSIPGFDARQKCWTRLSLDAHAGRDALAPSNALQKQLGGGTLSVQGPREYARLIN